MPTGDYFRNKTHCPHGHEYSIENTYNTKCGKRQCRKCAAIRTLKRYALYPERAIAATRDWQKRNPDKTYVYEEDRKLRRFKLTRVEYNNLLLNQGGVCAICKKDCLTGKKLAIDHDHITGKIRGLLCSNCNNGLGRFHENPKYLESAVEYLKIFNLT